ncbi:hypothetical protein VNI00_013978 [Paramarasmius palmivorus]|uniref:Uncharacterized protein n=1 Tax=Paramarasmius palmivorus TaxID=297713 RepID=A0AAW0BVD6_9AGAR
MAEQPALFIPLYIGSLPSNSPSLGRSPAASITTLPSRSSSPSTPLSSLTSPSSGSTVNVRDSVLSDVGRNQYNRRDRSNDLKDSFNHYGDRFVDNSNNAQNNDGRRWNNSTANQNFYGSPGPDHERNGRMSPRQPGDFNSSVVPRPKLLPPANIRQRPDYPRSRTDKTHARGSRSRHPLSQVDDAEHDHEYFSDDDTQRNRARHPTSFYDSDGEEGDDEHAPDSDDSGYRNPSSGDESGNWEKWPRHGGNGARRALQPGQDGPHTNNAATLPMKSAIRKGGGRARSVNTKTCVVDSPVVAIFVAPEWLHATMA